jgi:hypothetical protein
MTPAQRLFKRALAEKTAFVDLTSKKTGQQATGPDGAPVDPAAAAPPAPGGLPMDPAAQAGAAEAMPVPGDPMAAGIPGAPADPMAAGAPPMDPAAAGAPPVDPMMDPAAAGAVPSDPMAGSLGEPPVDGPSGDTAVTSNEAKVVMDIVERTLAAVGKKKTPGAPGAPGGAGGAPGAPPADPAAAAAAGLPPGPVTGLPGDLSALAGAGPMKLASILNRTPGAKLAAALKRATEVPMKTVEKETRAEGNIGDKTKAEPARIAVLGGTEPKVGTPPGNPEKTSETTGDQAKSKLASILSRKLGK